MKNATLKAASLAALVLITASSMPLVHAQSLGDLVKKAKKKMGDAVGDAGDAPKGDAPSRSGDAPPRMDGQPSAPTDNAPVRGSAYNGPDSTQIEAQIKAALHKVLPKNTRMFILGCQPNASGGFSFKGAYIVKTPSGYRSANFPAIPASIQAQFATLRKAAANDNGGHHLFDACRLNVPGGLEDGDINEGNTETVGFNYFFKDASEFGMLPSMKLSEYKIPTAPQVLATALKVTSADAAHQRGAAREEAKETRRVAKAHADAARRAGHGDLTWVCTYCHHTYRWPEKPNGYDTGACDDSSSGKHNWVRK